MELLSEAHSRELASRELAASKELAALKAVAESARAEVDFLRRQLEARVARAAGRRPSI